MNNILASSSKLVDIKRKIYRHMASGVLKNPERVRHIEPSVICSGDDTSGPSEFIIDVSLQAIKIAWMNEIECYNRNKDDSRFYNVFPGEHYRLLKALVEVLRPECIVEIGTYTGMGTVALSEGNVAKEVYTFDIHPWTSFPSHLTAEHFEKKSVTQVLSDLSDPDEFKKHRALLNRAELIFMDAPKDGVFEYKFLDLLSSLEEHPRKLLILDDIRFVNMTDLWRQIKSPKLDVTSFGHWSGTGLVDISRPLQIER